MEPITMGLLAGYQLISAYQSAEMIRDNAKLTKQIADMNAQYAELDSYKAEQGGYSMVARYQTSIDKIMSNQRVAMAANDVDINYGTAKAFQAEAKLTADLNKLDLLNQAHAQALGYSRQARNVRLQGDQAVAQGNLNANATWQAGIFNAATTVTKGFESKAKSDYDSVVKQDAATTQEYAIQSGGYSTRAPKSYLGFEGSL